MTAGRPRIIAPEDRGASLRKYYEDPEAGRARYRAWQQAQKSDLELFLRYRLAQVKGRAKLKHQQFSLDIAWLAQQPRHCAVTGRAFEITEKGKGPFTPSFDQIIPNKGYTPENTRLVCCWYNLAKANWDDTLIQEAILEAAKYIKAAGPKARDH